MNWRLTRVSASSLMFGGVLGAFIATIATPEKRPCIYNFSDSWLFYMEQSELIDIDDTEVEKQFHDIIISVLEKQNNLYVSKYGIEYVVPSYCYVEDTGFFVKLWKNE